MGTELVGASCYLIMSAASFIFLISFIGCFGSLFKKRNILLIVRSLLDFHLAQCLLFFYAYSIFSWSIYAFSALTLLVGRQEGHPACKKLAWWGAGVVICLEWGADLHMAQLMPLPLTVSCYSKIQIGFTFLVPAQPGSPRQMAVKWVSVSHIDFGDSLTVPSLLSSFPAVTCQFVAHLIWKVFL